MRQAGTHNSAAPERAAAVPSRCFKGCITSSDSFRTNCWLTGETNWMFDGIVSWGNVYRLIRKFTFNS